MRNVLPPGCYFGERLRTCQAGPIAITETAYADGETLEAHSHETTNVFVVVSGRLTETVGRVSVMHGPDTVVFNPVGLSHHTAFQGPCTRVLNLQFEESWLAPLCERLALVRPARSAPAHLSARLFREFRSGDDLSSSVIEGLVHELLAELGRVGPRVRRSPPAWLRRAERILEETFPHAPSLGELAAEVGVERTHLARSFRRHLGRSVGETVRAARVRRAEAMLADRGLSLAEIALDCGFVDQSHLNRAFQVLRGISPGRMRRDMQGRFDPSREG